MTRPHHVDLDAADNLITAAVLMVGDNNHAVLALLMTAAAQLILDANETPARAIAAAEAAGPPLGEMVRTLAQVRLAEARVGGTA
jgi:hypothetical protein